MSGIAGSIGAAPAAVGAMLAAMNNRGAAEHRFVTVHNGMTLGFTGSVGADFHKVDNWQGQHGYLGVQDGEFYHLQSSRDPHGNNGSRNLAADKAASPSPQPNWLQSYAADGPLAVKSWHGVFALAATGPDGLWLARDPLGVKPLYYGFDDQGRLWFASQIKPLLQQVAQPLEFPPGYFYHSRSGFHPYYRLPTPTGDLADVEAARAALNERLQKAVELRLQGRGKMGVMLSGGLDSSLCAALALKTDIGRPLPSFAMGLARSDDIEEARAVARTLQTVHYERIVQPEEVIAVLPEIIYDLEAFDAAMVRGAVANHFAADLARQHSDAVLSGEGADELFAGYHYLKHPRVQERLEDELQNITRDSSRTTLQRLDRMSSRHALVARVPFLDLSVVDFAWRIPSRWKLHRQKGIEKWLLRSVAEMHLPREVAWRTKAKLALGTGVGPVLQAYARENITEAQFAREWRPWPGLELRNREELLYFNIFRDMFGHRGRAISRVMGRSPSLDDDQFSSRGEKEVCAAT